MYLQLKRILFLTIFCVLAQSLMSASQYLTIGPEFYHMWRLREGGTRQSGTVTGGRISYDRIKGCSWYLGADAFLGTGTLAGHNSRGRAIASKVEDRSIEARGGYTLKSQCDHFITPFVGYGHFCERNTFHAPSPIPFTFIETYNYIATGFLTGVNFTPLLSMGINIKAEFMVNGRSKVKNDPLLNKVSLKFKDEINAKVEVPLIYRFCLLKRHFGAILTPFYAFRHFGGKLGFPFDYADTKFHLLGVRASLGYSF